jgi:SWIM zinc finger
MAKTMTIREQLEARIKAAWINGGPEAATPRGNGRFLVTGRDGETRYTVHVLASDAATCDCPAGLHGRACWHAAAAYLRTIADAMVPA